MAKTDGTKIEMTEEEFEERLNRSYQVGVSAGMDRVAKMLMEDAAGYFKADQDEKAKLLRHKGKNFKSMADEAHPGPPEDPAI